MPFVLQRKKTRQIKVGGVPVGGSAPVSVQSMTNTPTSDVDATVSQINRLQDAGCELVRVAVPDAQAAEAVAAIKRKIYGIISSTQSPIANMSSVSPLCSVSTLNMTGPSLQGYATVLMRACSCFYETQ